MNILDQIVADKRVEIDRRKEFEPLEGFKGVSLLDGRAPSFVHRLRSVPMGLIAEVKRRSPSKGAIRDPMDPAALAGWYESAGANAISCLLDGKYFGGGEADFGIVRGAVELPLLYKEFVVDAWQVWRAKYLGASAVLLIVAALEREALEILFGTVKDAGLEALVEVHNKEEMRVAVDLDAPCIGINNRDLKTFTVSIDTTLSVKELAPADCTVVSESGIRSADDVLKLQREGVHGILVGEHLLRQANVERAIKDLMGGAWGSS